MKEELDWDALDAAIKAGEQAQEAIADWYDSLTEDDIEEMWNNATEVGVTKRPDNFKVTYQVSFTEKEAVLLRKASDSDASVITLIHDGAVNRASTIYLIKRSKPVLDRLARGDQKGE